MKFAEAEKRLAEIAHGRYHSLEYEKLTHEAGRIETNCGIYIDGEDWYHASTWSAAFSARMEKLAPTIEETPDE